MYPSLTALGGRALNRGNGGQNVAPLAVNAPGGVNAHHGIPGQLGMATNPTGLETLLQMLAALGITPAPAAAPQVAINDNLGSPSTDREAQRIINKGYYVPSESSDPNAWVNDHFFLDTRAQAQAKGIIGPKSNDDRRK
jgi:hypothetical protein